MNGCGANVYKTFNIMHQKKEYRPDKNLTLGKCFRANRFTSIEEVIKKNKDFYYRKYAFL